MDLKRPPVVACNTLSLIYASILGYFFNFKCLLANKPLGKLSHFPWRKLLPQQSKTKDKRDSLKWRKSFFVWKAKLPKRSPFLPLEEAGLLLSIKGAPVPSSSMLTPAHTYANLAAFCPSCKLGFLISSPLSQKYGSSCTYLKNNRETEQNKPQIF